MDLEENSKLFDLEQTVSFRIEDIFHPDHEEVLRAVRPDFKFRGKIQYFSSAGDGKQRYAVIEAENMTTPLIVSVMDLKSEQMDHKQ